MSRTKWDEMSPRERDALVATEVMKVGTAQVGRDTIWLYEDGWNHRPEPYTTSISAAWEVVEKMDQTLSLRQYPYNRTYAVFGKWEDDDAWSEANSPHATPEAICLAALRAKGVEV